MTNKTLKEQCYVSTQGRTHVVTAISVLALDPNQRSPSEHRVTFHATTGVNTRRCYVDLEIGKQDACELGAELLEIGMKGMNAHERIAILEKLMNE